MPAVTLIVPGPDAFTVVMGDAALDRRAWYTTQFHVHTVGTTLARAASYSRKYLQCEMLLLRCMKQERSLSGELLDDLGMLAGCQVACLSPPACAQLWTDTSRGGAAKVETNF